MRSQSGPHKGRVRYQPHSDSCTAIRCYEIVSGIKQETAEYYSAKMLAVHKERKAAGISLGKEAVKNAEQFKGSARWYEGDEVVQMNIARNAVEGTEIGRLLLRYPHLTLSHVLAETGTYPVYIFSTDSKAPAGTSPLLLKKFEHTSDLSLWSYALPTDDASITYRGGVSGCKEEVVVPWVTAVNPKQNLIEQVQVKDRYGPFRFKANFGDQPQGPIHSCMWGLMGAKYVIASGITYNSTMAPDAATFHYIDSPAAYDQRFKDLFPPHTTPAEQVPGLWYPTMPPPPEGSKAWGVAAATEQLDSLVSILWPKQLTGVHMGRMASDARAAAARLASDGFDPDEQAAAADATIAETLLAAQQQQAQQQQQQQQAAQQAQPLDASSMAAQMATLTPDQQQQMQAMLAAMLGGGQPKRQRIG
ncbi:hypothetical protein COHA_010312 [Chlorella ohadii]|uniref:Uncharacterized protein n=1 Tax=Chlorella ohadii TaxID=2649997 RepID=A0AAD5H1E2_9CHLO|nr:hypothetical protein COHA_010312 [Chlorella ohadii]